MAGHFRVNEGIVGRSVPPELVLLDLPKASFLVARGLGPKVWELLESGQSVDDVVAAIVERYDVDSARVQSDVEAFVSACCEHNLLIGEPAGA